MTDDEIRKTVQKKFADGTLQRHYSVAARPRGARPGEEVAETAFSVGSAYPDPCAVCGEPSTQLRYELHRVAFHHRCHKIWEEEAAKPIRR
jgi:hypothetical protein